MPPDDAFDYATKNDRLLGPQDALVADVAVADAEDVTTVDAAADATPADVPDAATADADQEVVDIADEVDSAEEVDAAEDVTTVEDAGGDEDAAGDETDAEFAEDASETDAALPDDGTAVDAEDAGGEDVDSVVDSGPTCTVASCDDGNNCTTDDCDGSGNCTHAPGSGPCSDGNGCTTGDFCSGTTCTATGVLFCNDANSCTVDNCSKGACTFKGLPVGTSCGKGKSCDGSQTCVVNDAVGMVSLNAGTFSMGSANGSSDEMPEHSVTLSSFALDGNEVSTAQYLKFYNGLQNGQNCSGSNKSSFSCGMPDTGGGCNWNVGGKDGDPINCVDWFQASAYCSWAGKRLPSEAEWEFAARSGGMTQTYPWGDLPADCSLTNFDDGSTGPGCGSGGTSPVCAHTSGNSSQGACDLAGNVSEWCADWYDVYSAISSNNPSGPASSPDGTKVVRGGGWDSVFDLLRAFARGHLIPSSRSPSVGFRCARTL